MNKKLFFFTVFIIMVFIASCACPPSELEEPPSFAAPEPSPPAAPELSFMPAAETPIFETPPVLPVEETPKPASQTAQTDSTNSEFSFSSNYFNPDEESLTISLPQVDIAPIANWSVEIREPEPPYLLFYEWRGEGNPPAQLIWNGKSSKGEWVQSATDYPLVYSARDIYGNTRNVESKITVDAFVIREGNNLRIMVPSIVFGANSGTWDGLDAETVANNKWIISRIALTLNKYNTYKVRIEGHANFTTGPGDIPGRLREQSRELQPLSELRARTVMDELLKLNVNSSRLSYSGMGGTYPVATWEDHNNWWKNRRVEFILSE